MVSMTYADATPIYAPATPIINDAHERAVWDEERQWQAVLARDVEADGYLFRVKGTVR